MSDVKPWPLFGYAPGNYVNTCKTCAQLFEGDKRAFMCLDCAARTANQQLSATALTELEQDNAKLRADAERWRSLMSSPKMHFMGSAGFEHILKADAPAGSRRLEHQIAVPKPDGYWHFGMEFWFGIPVDARYPDTFERQMLTAYVDAIRARAALASQTSGGE